MSNDVLSGANEKRGVILEDSERTVTVCAEKTTDTAGLMAVVYGQSPSRRAWFQADSAYPTLRDEKLVVSLDSQTKVSPQIFAPVGLSGEFRIGLSVSGSTFPDPLLVRLDPQPVRFGLSSFVRFVPEAGCLTVALAVALVPFTIDLAMVLGVFCLIHALVVKIAHAAGLDDRAVASFNRASTLRYHRSSLQDRSRRGAVTRRPGTLIVAVSG